MPKVGLFKVNLVSGGLVLPEVRDTASGKCYAVCTAGSEYKIRMQADGKQHYGAIIQVDGSPAEADFAKSPFTYFKNPYDDPGFWTEPSAGKYIPRVFSQPEAIAGGLAPDASSGFIGRIRVYFFEVEYVQNDDRRSRGKQYSAPKTPSLNESKKWFLAGNTTRYGKTSSTGSKGGVYRIKDRTQWLTYAETWYKDGPGMELLGWDGAASEVELVPPAVRAKRKAEAEAEAARKRGKIVADGGVVPDEQPKPKPVVIDLTLDD